MKYIITIILISITRLNIYSQDDINNIQGVWQFIPPNASYDSTWLIFYNNKSLDITYWNEDKRSSAFGRPYSYFGFWDTSYFGGEDKPKSIMELKPIGRFVFFYDNLIKNLNEENKIGYDSIGNLYRPNRWCDWGFIDDGNGIEFNFGPEPDVYKRVEKVPDYVLLSLKQNKEHWKKYLDFIEHKELIIRVEKSRIFSTPNQLTKMYLVKGDEVEVVEEKEQWLRIRYYGNGATSRKIIEGWIKKTDVE